MKDAIVFFSIVITGLLFWLAFNREPVPRFRRKSVLTGSQAEFFALLRSALPECALAPNVAVSSLIEPLGSLAARRGGLRRIDGQRVPYAIFDNQLQLLAVIELTQRSRPSRKEAERDKFFASAGIRTIRFHVKQLPSEARIRRNVFKPMRDNRSRTPDYRSQPVDYHPPAARWLNTLSAHS